MKVFKIVPSNFDWDEWKSVVIVAEDEKRALDIATNESQPYDPYKEDEDQHDICFKFEEHQMPLKVEEINLEKESIVVSEFQGS